MKLRDRYHRLTLWNKIEVCGALASFVSLLFFIVFSVFQPAPLLHVSLDDVFENLKRQDADFEKDPLVARTFWLLREQGATIVLGTCPGPDCFQFTLGQLRTEGGKLIQQIFLSGPGFGVRLHPVPGMILRMDNRIHIKGSSLNIGTGGKKMWVELALARGNLFEMSTEVADISFRVLDTRSDSLRIHLEVRRGIWVPPRQRQRTRPAE
jgi:hypothetical protein